MHESKSSETQAKRTRVNDQPKHPQRVISNPKDVAQLVLMQIDKVNATKDDLTTAVKGLADTAKQLVRVYAQQQNQITKLAKRLEDIEKPQGE